MTAPINEKEAIAAREDADFGAFGSGSATPEDTIETMPGVCPSCKGTQGRVIVHNQQSYWQCMTPKGENGPPCKFWSTKMRV